jgi:membrane protease YdiL (CAAX protease family)
VLSPDLPFVSWLLVALFVGVTAFLAVRASRKDRREYQRFKRYRSTVRRQAMYRKWLRESFLVFGGLAVVLLVLVWQFLPLLLADVNALPFVRGARTAFMDAGGVAYAVTAILAVLFLIVPLVLLFFVNHDGEDLPALGDIQALLPRNRAEVRLGALMSLNAGVVEELLFRLAMPALLYGAFGSSLFALIVSVLLFGGLHAYQGAGGILATVVIGAVLLALYIATGNILVPIVVHALIDLRSFVAIPLIVLKVPR